MPIQMISKEQYDQYGNRTFDRALFVYTAMIDKPVVYSAMNEVHRTGEVVRDPIKWSVIAPSREFADFAFGDRFERELTNAKPSDVVCEVFPICAEIANMRYR